MNLLVTICGRGGSKGIPGKNVKEIAGKPLLHYTIETALKFAEGKNAVIGLSTDSEEIIAVAEKAGITTSYRRPEELASDNAGKIAAITDVFNYEEKRNNLVFDYVIDLDITSPLRTVEDIENGLAMLEHKEDAFNLFSVNPAGRNPYFNMVEAGEDGFFHLSKKGLFFTRQSSPKVYDINGSFYIYRRSFFEEGNNSAITSRSLVYEMPHICFDLDNPVDFYFMEYLLENNKLDFKLS